jgi:hypothetical protein
MLELGLDMPGFPEYARKVCGYPPKRNSAAAIVMESAFFLIIPEAQDD